MNCTKCGKEIPEGDKKICDECQKKLLAELDEESNVEKSDVISDVEKKDVISDVEKKDVISDVEKNSEFKNKKNIKFIPIVIISFIIFVVIVGIILKNNTTNNTVGNSIANIRNYGYITEQCGIIYYIAPSENGEKISIYKTDKNKIQPKELIKDNWDVLGLNVVDDYLYFIAISNEEIEKSSTLSVEEESLDTLNNKIYRMKTDGTELEVINSNEFHNNCYEIYVIKDKIYYIGVDANIWYMNLDGSGKTRLNDDKTGFLGLTDDYILLNIEKKQENPEEQTAPSVATTTYETCIMNLDGTERKSLTGERLYSINVVDDYIYYVNSNKAIYKVKIDGTENTKVSDEVQAYNMNIINNKIFYMNYSDSTQNKISIYSMNLDGTDIKEIKQLENYSSFLNTINNNVIFMDSNENAASINMINLDGTESRVLYELKRAEILKEQEHEHEGENTTTESTPTETTTQPITNTEITQ